MKVSLKLSVGIWIIWKFHWNFHWNFPLQVKVSMKLSTKQNSFMKLSLKNWKFHIIFIYEIVIETFSCEGKFPTESFSKTFTKLSSHVHLIIFSIKKCLKNGKMFVQKNSKKLIIIWHISIKFYHLKTTSKPWPNQTKFQNHGIPTIVSTHKTVKRWSSD